MIAANSIKAYSSIENNLLYVITQLSSLLLSDHENCVIEALSLIGEATEVDRVYIFQNTYSEHSNEVYISQIYEWSRNQELVQIYNEALQNISYNDGFARWFQLLSSNVAVEGLVEDFPIDEQPLLTEQNILSLLAMPINVNNKFWGFIGFDDCRSKRIWTQNEKDLLSIVANNMGMSISRDIYLEELKKARNEALIAVKLKSNFLANMSHEIRTPLNTIVGIIDLLQASDFDPEHKQNIEVLKNSSYQLLGITRNILDIVRLEKGNEQLNNEYVNLHQLIQTMVNQTDLRNKELILNYVIDPLIANKVFTDQEKLREVLTQLIDNAIKFTPKGSIKIVAQLISTSQNKKEIKFTVEDTGIGISKDNLKTIFDIFYQVNSNYDKQYQGVGIGLTLVKRIVDLFDGKLFVKSDIGKGTTIGFTIPYNPKEINEEHLERPIKRQNWSQKKLNVVEANHVVEETRITQKESLSILLVDDSDDNRFLIHTYLKKMKVTIDDAENGEIAVEKFKEKGYDLVLMDIQMPIMDGLTATRLIREYEREKGMNETTIIALTAYSFKEDLDKTLDAGCSGYLTKPVKKSKIKEVVSQL